MEMKNPIPTLLFLGMAALGWFAFGRNGMSEPMNFLYFGGWMIFAGFLSSTIRIANQWEKALVFRLGRFQSLKGPGLFTVLPGFDVVRLVDTRIQTLDIPMQQAITKDNVPVTLDGVIFLRVENPAEAVIRVQNYQHAIKQYAQTALRDVIGSVTLDEILADREAVGRHIEQMVDQEIAGWGLDVAGIRIQDLVLPEDLKKVLARQASAEREKRANITKSEGDRMAAENLAAAAETMYASPGALQLRTLQTLDSLGSSPSNTVVLAVPLEMMNGQGGQTVTQIGINAGMDHATKSQAKAPSSGPSSLPQPPADLMVKPPVQPLSKPAEIQLPDSLPPGS